MEKLFSLISSNKYKNIIVMCGAGISVASGIPDFRSPKFGLYPSIKKELELKKKKPTFVFEIETFLHDPRPFWWIFTKLWKKTSKAAPTSFHFFIKLLNEKGLLRRCYTQNIDGLEELAGLPKEKVVHAHGVIDTCHCMMCNKEYPLRFCMNQISENLTNKNPTIEKTKVTICDNCGSKFVKPDAVFFHQDLPDYFFDQYPQDFKNADLLIIAGTSLEVYPFASLPSMVNNNVPRFLINKNQIKFPKRYKTKEKLDWFIEGDCQEFANEICNKLGWKNELNSLISSKKTVDETYSINDTVQKENGYLQCGPRV